MFGTFDENISRVANYIAKNSWEGPWQYHFQIEARLNGKFKESVYKDAFANFYHSNSFVSIYNDTFDTCLDDIIQSHHLWYEEPEKYHYITHGFRSVEDCCNTIFERRAVKEIFAASQSVVKNMTTFVEEIIIKTVKLGEYEENIWRRWLEHNKKSWGMISNVSGFTMVV